MATLLDASAVDVQSPKVLQSKVSLGGSVVRLVQNGVIVPEKLRKSQPPGNRFPANRKMF